MQPCTRRERHLCIVRCPHPIAARMTRGETPLHRAAAFGTEHSIELLLGAGAAREAKDVNGDTPLSWASWYARPDEILRRLCYGTFTVHPDRVPMKMALRGRPHG